VDGEEWIETEALGWTGHEICLRMSDPRYRDFSRGDRRGGAS
jgi:hypothetical protein